MYQHLVRVIPLPIVVSVALLACDDEPTANNILCPGVLTPGVEVWIVDASTNIHGLLGFTHESTTGRTFGTARDDDRLDSLRAGQLTQDTLRSIIGITQPGRYEVTVRIPGYRDWTTSPSRVEVRSGTCGLATVDLRAGLEPR